MNPETDKADLCPTCGQHADDHDMRDVSSDGTIGRCPTEFGFRTRIDAMDADALHWLIAQQHDPECDPRLTDAEYDYAVERLTRLEGVTS